MLDLGGTLVSGNPLTVLPHAREALSDIREIEASPGVKLEMCLVSDFTMPPIPATPAMIESLESEYAAILEELEIDTFFEPFHRRVTLSTHAAVRKPDCRVFQMALFRLEMAASFSECLFITEAADHIARAQELTMHTLRFGTQAGVDIDFHDWSAARDLIVNRIQNS